jgi:hypothetical protein
MRVQVSGFRKSTHGISFAHGRPHFWCDGHGHRSLHISISSFRTLNPESFLPGKSPYSPKTIRITVLAFFDAKPWHQQSVERRHIGGGSSGGGGGSSGGGVGPTSGGLLEPPWPAVSEGVVSAVVSAAEGVTPST